MSMRRQLLFKLLLIPLSLFVAIMLAEICIQLVGDPRKTDQERFLRSHLPHYSLAHLGLLQEDPDPRIRFGLRPGFHARIGEDLYRVNGLGLRGGPVPPNKPAGNRRILILGDSYAFGFGVDEAETLGAHLERDLRKDCGNVTVLNMAVPGYQTGQELALLQRDGFRLQPDLVVLVYYANDNVQATFHYDPRLKICYVDELPLPRGLKRFMARFALYAMVTKAYTQHLDKTGVLDARNKANLEVTTSRLSKIAELCRQQKVKLLVAAIPGLTTTQDLLNKDHIDTELHWRILAHLREQGIPTVDFRPVLIQRLQKSTDIQDIKVLFLTDGERTDNHLNAEGYGLLAGQIAARIRELHLLGE